MRTNFTCSTTASRSVLLATIFYNIAVDLLCICSYVFLRFVLRCFVLDFYVFLFPIWRNFLLCIYLVVLCSALK